MESNCCSISPENLVEYYNYFKDQTFQLTNYFDFIANEFDRYKYNLMNYIEDYFNPPNTLSMDKNYIHDN